MLNKQIRKKALRQTFYDLSVQLTRLRQDKNLSIADLSALSKIPDFWLESLESKSFPFNIGYLTQLASFYDKRIKIELVDVVDDND